MLLVEMEEGEICIICVLAVERCFWVFFYLFLVDDVRYDIAQ